MHNTTSNNPPNNILKEIHSKTDYMNTQSKNYINDAVAIIKREIGIDGIVSIILFGSQLYLNENQNESTKISDCDLLFIFHPPQFIFDAPGAGLTKVEIKE